MDRVEAISQEYLRLQEKLNPLPPRNYSAIAKAKEIELEKKAKAKEAEWKYRPRIIINDNKRDDLRGASLLKCKEIYYPFMPPFFTAEDKAICEEYERKMNN